MYKLITFNPPKLTLEEFAGLYNLSLEVHARYLKRGKNLPKYYVHFGNNIEFINHPNDFILTDYIGNGNTPKEAIADFRKKISKKILVKDAFINRREIKVPQLVTKSRK